MFLFFFFLAAYSISRLSFLLFNWEIFQEHSQSEIFEALWGGLRFDISILSLISLPYLLLQLIPAKGVLWKRFLIVVFLIPNLPAFLLNLIDIEYFAIAGRRLGSDLFTSHSDEILKQIPQFAVNYWHFVGITVLVGWISWEHTRRSLLANKTYFQRVPLIVLGLLLLVLGIRGGFQVKPLHMAHAFEYGRGQLATLALNAPFAVYRGRGQETLSPPNAVPTPAELRSVFANPDSPPTFRLPPNTNIVLLVMESFSEEYTGLGEGPRSYTPFLDSLAKNQGVFFRNHFASGRESIHLIPAIFAGVPQLMRDAYVRSKYARTQVLGAGKIFHKYNYDTSFFHGGQNGSMHFDAFLNFLGFKNYYGLNEYPHPEQYDGVWGIPDHLYLPWVAKTLSQKKTPFLSGVFTLSSHQPYYVAPELKGQFPKGTLAIHESIGYADYSLKLFFEAAKKEAWYKNTLFIVTADHTQKCETPQYCNLLGRFKVPLVFFHPTQNLKELPVQRVSSHVDLLKTLIDAANLNLSKEEKDSLSPFGSSLFREGSGQAIIYNTRELFWIDPQSVSFWRAGKDWQKNTGSDSKRKIEIIRGFYNSSLIGGALKSSHN